MREDLTMVRWVTVQTDTGPVRALVFWAGPKGDGIALKLPLGRVAWILARACGHVGSCASYLYNTVAKLEEFGIHDQNLWRLQELVAGEIKNFSKEDLAQLVTRAAYKKGSSWLEADENRYLPERRLYP